MESLQTCAAAVKQPPLCCLNRYPVLIAPILSAVKNGKNGKPYVLQLQDKEDDGLQFDLAAETLEELFKWYEVAWDITQRAMNQQYNREQEASGLSHSPSRDVHACCIHAG